VRDKRLGGKSLFETRHQFQNRGAISGLVEEKKNHGGWVGTALTPKPCNVLLKKYLLRGTRRTLTIQNGGNRTGLRKRREVEGKGGS